MKKTVLLITALIISGCASGPSEKAFDQSWSRDTLNISCESKCSVSYTDPRDRLQQQENPWLSGFKAAIGAVFSPHVAMAAIAYKGFDSIKSNNIDNSSYTSSVNNSDNSMRESKTVNNTDNSRRYFMDNIGNNHEYRDSE